MALTPERIREMWENYSPTQGIASFARSVEAEVRAQDTALIRQLVEALEGHAGNYKLTKPEAAQINVALEAARARLGDKS